MKYKIFILIGLLIFCFTGQAQKYMTKTGYAYFKSHTDAIDIDGSNNKVAAILDISNGEFVAIVLIKAFNLPLATADKHFNETYLESDKFPKATFKGKILEVSKLDLSKDGEFPVTAEGVLSIHGQEFKLIQTGKIKIEKGSLICICDFQANINDFKIVVPNDVKDRVAKIVDIKVEFALTPMAQ